MPTTTEKPSDVSQAAEKLYEEKLRQKLEPKHIGEVIAIEPVSGEHVLSRTLDEVDKACEIRFGLKPVHVFRIGGGGAVKITGGQRFERAS